MYAQTANPNSSLAFNASFCLRIEVYLANTASMPQGYSLSHYFVGFTGLKT